MIAKGKSMMEAEMDFQYQVFKLMMEQYPKLVKQCAEQWEQQIQEETIANSDGDEEIQLSMQANHPLNDVIDLQKESIAFFNNVMMALIESYAEAHLHTFSQDLSPKRKPKLLVYYDSIKQNYPDLPNINDIWPNFKNFIDKRNMFIHELSLETKTNDINLIQQLDYAYNLLSKILQQINTKNQQQ